MDKKLAIFASIDQHNWKYSDFEPNSCRFWGNVAKWRQRAYIIFIVHDLYSHIEYSCSAKTHFAGLRLIIRYPVELPIGSSVATRQNRSKTPEVSAPGGVAVDNYRVFWTNKARGLLYPVIQLCGRSCVRKGGFTFEIWKACVSQSFELLSWLSASVRRNPWGIFQRTL